jgi:hypothetical protein
VENVPELKAHEVSPTPEALATAVVAKLVDSDPGVACESEIFDDKQARIFDTMVEDLNDELAMSLRNQLRSEQGAPNGLTT